jgi:hypothetical protein
MYSWLPVRRLSDVFVKVENDFAVLHAFIRQIFSTLVVLRMKWSAVRPRAAFVVLFLVPTDAVLQAPACPVARGEWKAVDASSSSSFDAFVVLVTVDY